jgi:hypothetical protein
LIIDRIVLTAAHLAPRATHKRQIKKAALLESALSFADTGDTETLERAGLSTEEVANQAWDEGLKTVREIAEPSSRGTAKGALLKESWAVFDAIQDGLPLVDVRSAILDGRLFQKTSIETRRSI